MQEENNKPATRAPVGGQGVVRPGQSNTAAGKKNQQATVQTSPAKIDLSSLASLGDVFSDNAYLASNLPTESSIESAAMGGVDDVPPDYGKLSFINNTLVVGYSVNPDFERSSKAEKLQKITELFANKKITPDAYLTKTISGRADINGGLRTTGFHGRSDLGIFGKMTKVDIEDSVSSMKKSYQKYQEQKKEALYDSIGMMLPNLRIAYKSAKLVVPADINENSFKALKGDGSLKEADLANYYDKILSFIKKPEVVEQYKRYNLLPMPSLPREEMLKMEDKGTGVSRNVEESYKYINSRYGKTEPLDLSDIDSGITNAKLDLHNKDFFRLYGLAGSGKSQAMVALDQAKVIYVDHKDSEQTIATKINLAREMTKNATSVKDLPVIVFDEIDDLRIKGLGTEDNPDGMKEKLDEMLKIANYTTSKGGLSFVATATPLSSDLAKDLKESQQYAGIDNDSRKRISGKMEDLSTKISAIEQNLAPENSYNNREEIRKLIYEKSGGIANIKGDIDKQMVAEQDSEKRLALFNLSSSLEAAINHGNLFLKDKDGNIHKDTDSLKKANKSINFISNKDALENTEVLFPESTVKNPSDQKVTIGIHKLVVEQLSDQNKNGAFKTNSNGDNKLIKVLSYNPGLNDERMKSLQEGSTPGELLKAAEENPVKGDPIYYVYMHKGHDGAVKEAAYRVDGNQVKHLKDENIDFVKRNVVVISSISNRENCDPKRFGNMLNIVNNDDVTIQNDGRSRTTDPAKSFFFSENIKKDALIKNQIRENIETRNNIAGEFKATVLETENVKKRPAKEDILPDNKKQKQNLDTQDIEEKDTRTEIGSTKSSPTTAMGAPDPFISELASEIARINKKIASKKENGDMKMEVADVERYLKCTGLYCAICAKHEDPNIKRDVAAHTKSIKSFGKAFIDNEEIMKTVNIAVDLANNKMDVSPEKRQRIANKIRGDISENKLDDNMLDEICSGLPKRFEKSVQKAEQKQDEFIKDHAASSVLNPNQINIGIGDGNGERTQGATVPNKGNEMQQR